MKLSLYCQLPIARLGSVNLRQEREHGLAARVVLAKLLAVPRVLLERPDVHLSHGNDGEDGGCSSEELWVSSARKRKGNSDVQAQSRVRKVKETQTIVSKK